MAGVEPHGLPEPAQRLIRVPLVMRVLVPGSVATAIIFPFTEWKVPTELPATSAAWIFLIPPLLSVLAFGVLLFAFGDEIYRVFEARILWPRFLFDWWTHRQQARVDRLLMQAMEAEKLKRIATYDETWFKLRMYPLNEDALPYASHPTLLGNVIGGYEKYPLTRYGMHSVFYWPRIWLQLDKEKQDAIDAAWSIVDGLVYTSAVTLLGGVTWIAIAGSLKFLPSSIVGLCGKIVPTFVCEMLPRFVSNPSFTPGACLWRGVIWVLLGYGLYRASLPFARSNGETFKAVFDLYRNRLEEMTKLAPSDKSTWLGVWSYLQYLRVRCKCGEYLRASEKKCPKCGHDTAKSLELLKIESPGGREHLAKHPHPLRVTGE